MYGYDGQVIKPYLDHIIDGHDSWFELEKYASPNKTLIASEHAKGVVDQISRFADWLNTAQFNDTAMMRLFGLGNSDITLNLNFTTDRTDTSRLKELLAQIAEPIGRALQADMIGATNASAMAVLRYAEDFQRPMFIVDKGGKLLEANSNAESLLVNHRAFYKPYGKVSLSQRVPSQLFRRLVDDTINTGQLNYMKIPAVGDDAELLAIFAPSPCPRSFVGKPQTIALIAIVGNETDAAHLSPLAETHGLTLNELQVLELFSTGLSQKEIASIRSLTHQRIREIFSDIYGKLGVKDVVDLTAFMAQFPRCRN